MWVQALAWLEFFFTTAIILTLGWLFAFGFPSWVHGRDRKAKILRKHLEWEEKVRRRGWKP